MMTFWGHNHTKTQKLNCARSYIASPFQNLTTPSLTETLASMPQACSTHVCKPASLHVCSTLIDMLSKLAEWACSRLKLAINAQLACRYAVQAYLEQCSLIKLAASNWQAWMNFCRGLALPHAPLTHIPLNSRRSAGAAKAWNSREHSPHIPATLVTIPRGGFWSGPVPTESGIAACSQIFGEEIRIRMVSVFAVRPLKERASRS